MGQIFNEKTILFLLILVAVVIVLHWINKHFKRINMPNVFLITGAVKTGKTLLAVHLARKELRNARIKCAIKNFFLRCLGRELEEKPMLYSNIPLAKTHYNLVTMDILLCKVRIPNKSIVLLDEASLIADSMMFKDKNINSRLMRFVKLFAHYTHGGKLIIDTQSLSDLHFAFKRCLNNYLYIYSRNKFPLITTMQVREMLYSDDGSMVNNSNEDIELSMRRIIILNYTYSLYDCYCYSVFTDHLPYQVKYDTKMLSKEDDMKAYQLVTFQDFGKEINALMLKIHQDKCVEYGFVVEISKKSEEKKND